MNRARQMNQNRAKLLKSAKRFHTKQINNLLTEENLCLFKNSPELFKVESATVYCHEYSYILLMRNVNIFAFSQMLTV